MRRIYGLFWHYHNFWVEAHHHAADSALAEEQQFIGPDGFTTNEEEHKRLLGIVRKEIDKAYKHLERMPYWRKKEFKF